MLSWCHGKYYRMDIFPVLAKVPEESVSNLGPCYNDANQPTWHVTELQTVKVVLIFR